jgi:acyl dehydratase
MTGLTTASQPGAEIRGRDYRLSPARMRAFSGGPFEMDGWPLVNIHTDLAHAQSCGLEKRNASGTQWQGYVIQMMLDLFGTGWLSQGTIETKFIRMVLEDDVITPWARVVERQDVDGGVNFTLEIGCDNQDGATVIAGSATGILPRA